MPCSDVIGTLKRGVRRSSACVRGGRTDGAAVSAHTPRGARARRPRSVPEVHAHTQTSWRGGGTATHGGGAAATPGRARDFAPARSRPQSVACAPVPLHDSPKIANKLQNP
jgi:hypothetical protein